MTDAPAARPLAARLTRRLALIAAAVAAGALAGIALHYTQDPRTLRDEALEQRLDRLEAALTPGPGGVPALDPDLRALFDRHPDAYAFALLDGAGRVLDGANLTLLPAPALETGLFAADWIARAPDGTGPLIASRRIADPDRYLRLVFAADDADPAGLVRRALLGEFAGHVLFPLAPALLILLAANALMIRRGLGPLAQAAAWARAVRPGAPVPPCPAETAAPEIADLVSAARRAMDRLAEALDGERRRAAEAAHALRTPVAVLTARLDDLPEGPAAERLRADVAALARTVRQVLDAAAAELPAGPDPVPVDLAALAEDAVAALAPFGFARGVTLALEVDPDARPALAEPAAVSLALVNLIENAVLHGRGAVCVQVGPGPAVTVEDDGPGLPPGDRAALFEPFRRGPAAPPGGAGLGLAIVARVQKALGGTVSAGDVPGGGARLRLGYRPAPSGADPHRRQVAVRPPP